MAIGSSDLALLFRLKAQNEASPVIKTAQADISRLTTSTSAQFRQMQSTTTQSLGAITQSLTQVAGQLPVVGNAIGGVANQLGTLTSTATTSASSVGLVAGAAVLAASALGGTLKALFDVTVQAAEFQGKMFDMSQQTGIAVETLSTLEIVAKTTGGSIEGITASLGIFQKKLEEAQDPTSKEAALLKELGIETNNTEEAFRQSLAVLAKMPEGFHQTATALELFGRGGKAILAILKEVDGDLDAATESFRDMGILISTDAAKAADKFNDQLALLGFQVRSVAAIVGNEAMPVVLEAIQSLSTELNANRDVLGQWVTSISDAANGAYKLASAVAYLGGILTGLNNIPIPGILTLLGSVSGVSGIFRGLEEIGRRGTFARASSGAGGTDAFAGVTGGAGLPGGGGGGGGGGRGGKRGGGQDELFKAALDESNRITAAQIEDARSLSVALKQAYDLNIVNLEDYYRKRQILIDDNFNTEIDAINREQEALDAALARGRIKKEDAAKKDAELTLRTTKARNKLEEETNQLQIDRQKALDQAELNRERQLAAIRVAVREGELARVEQLVERHAALESSLLTVRLQQEKEAHDEQMLLLDIELKQLTTSAERKAELDNKKIESEQRYTDRIKQLTQERINVLNEEAAATSPSRVEEPNFAGIGAAIEELLGPPPEDTFDAWKDAFQTLRQIGADAMADLAFGVGSLVQNWVLLGDIGPKAVRKFTASVLAGVASQAAVKAIFELAEGFAALFRNPAEAAAHFTSAAIFGSIAGVAAVAGRAVAGDAFQQNTSRATSGGSTRSGSTATSTSVAATDADRRVAAPASMTINLGLKDGIVAEHFRRDYLLNGPTRLIIKTDGQG